MKIKSIIFFILICIFSSNCFPKILSEEHANSFINVAINENKRLKDFVDEREIKISKRLGIQYEGILNKFFISYEIDTKIREEIRNNRYEYLVKINRLEGDFSQLKFSVPLIKYQKKYYFDGMYLISPITYHTLNWRRFESDHFVFIISDTSLFNSYCIQNLEKYFEKISGILKINQENIKINKIYYVLCKNEEEINSLTGFNTRGMYNLAYDCVISTYNAHYHELVHLLINYKLHNLPLYTHPFIQEGIAVALGGRGGKEPEVIHSLGEFLNNSQILNYTTLLTKNGFYQIDASLSYPLSGLYNLFLVNELAIDKYLDLYRKFSGTSKEIDKMVINPEDLPDQLKWQNFLVEFKNDKSINLKFNKQNRNKVFHNSVMRIFESDSRYYFEIKDTLCISSTVNKVDFKSKKFCEFFKNKKYNNEKYLISVNANEISIYNLFSNNLIANYVSAFSIPNNQVSEIDGFYHFSVRKDVFDEKLKNILK